MAFKMKGSPIKLGKIQGTAGHASALKQTKEQKEQLEEKLAEEEGKAKSAVEMKSPMKGLEGAAHSGHNRTHHLEEVAPDLRKKEKSPAEMKSPMKLKGIYRTDEFGNTEQISESQIDDGSGGNITYSGKDYKYKKGHMPHNVSSSGDILGEMTEQQFTDMKNKSLAKNYELKGGKGNPATGKGGQRRAAILDETIQNKINKGIELSDEEKQYQATAIKNL
jgi:hypothetical protein